MKSAPKKRSEKESSENALNTMRLEKVKELEDKLKKLNKLLRNGRKNAGIELLAATTKKRLAKAREMCDIHTLIQVKSKHLDSHSDDEAVAPNRSKNSPNKTLSQEYGNYYNMRCNILHMESHKHAIISSKGLQGFLSEYQKNLAKCFQFEQQKTVQDLFATSRIHKLSEESINNHEPTNPNPRTNPSPVRGPKSVRTIKSTVSEETMREVNMEEDLDTVVSMDRSWILELELDKPVNTDVLRETNFLDQFLMDKVTEFVQAAASTSDLCSPTFPLFGVGNVSECVSDWRLEHLMSIRTKSNRSVASVKNHFVNVKPNKSCGKSSDVIPIKHATAMTNIKKLILSVLEVDGRAKGKQKEFH